MTAASFTLYILKDGSTKTFCHSLGCLFFRGVLELGGCAINMVYMVLKTIFTCNCFNLDYLAVFQIEVSLGQRPFLCICSFARYIALAAWRIRYTGASEFLKCSA